MNRASVGDFYRTRIDQMIGEIRTEPEATILGTASEELAEYYADKYSLPEIQIIKGPELEIIEEVKDLPEHKRDPMYQGEGPLRNFQFKRAVINTWVDDFPNLRNFWSYDTSTFSFSHSPSDFIIDQNRIGFGFDIKGYGFEKNEDQIAQLVDNGVSKLNQYIAWKNADIRTGNSSVKNAAQNEINARRESIEKNKTALRSLETKISIPLIKRTAAEPIQPKVQVKRAVRKLKPEAKPIEQYELNHQQVVDIVRFIDSYMKSLENTPASIATLGEEEIRDLMLAHLNEVFEGGATGETFSKKGKTDIYLRINKGNILVIECKIWGGEQLLHKTIDQIRGYLTWRHNYGVIIFFARNKNFTQVRNVLKENITKSSSYVSGFKELDTTHFVANHRLDDEDKIVEMHYQIYNLYSKR